MTPNVNVTYTTPCPCHAIRLLRTGDRVVACWWGWQTSTPMCHPRRCRTGVGWRCRWRSGQRSQASIRTQGPVKSGWRGRRCSETSLAHGGWAVGGTKASAYPCARVCSGAQVHMHTTAHVQRPHRDRPNTDHATQPRPPTTRELGVGARSAVVAHHCVIGARKPSRGTRSLRHTDDSRGCAQQSTRGQSLH
jgi:hypothetical protein